MTNRVASPPLPVADLMAQLPIGDIFDRLADTVFFIKDLRGRYILANSTLAHRCKQPKEKLIGRLPSEFLGKTLGERYEAQDRSVLDSGLPILDRLELHAYPDRTIGWCITNKFPIFDAAGAIVGVTGISKDLGAPDLENSDFAGLNFVIDYVKQNLARNPTVTELANLANLSPYQLDRRLFHVFGLTTGQWVLKQRLDVAQRDLITSEKSIAEVSLDCGYEDQSAFSRQFRKTTGLTPTEFRRLYMEGD